MVFFRHLKGHIEALLFANGEPVPAGRISEILDIPEEQLKLVIEELKEDMNDALRGLTIVEGDGGYQLCSKPQFCDVIEKLNVKNDTKLSTAALETLAIIAFKQPITRLEVETIRGVKVDRVVNTLLERKLIRELGRKEALGRPILYGTTNEFLLCFGLKNLNDLPSLTSFLSEQPE